ncbi:hypothetical protein CUJ88_48400 (plasmid) [Paraburkholderia hospita]|nr:hypothetical protein CUJ88_48400 [Paraburkholderia hospita]
MESHGALHAMNRRLNLDEHLQGTLKHNGSRRAFAARLDMTIKRAKVTSGRVARSLGVPEHEVTLWRAGVTVPKSADCARLSELLDVDVAWLCAVQA